jgi:hypothetical protein
MNTPLLLKIADTIAKHPEKFNMSLWHGYTAGKCTHCIGGWAEAIHLQGVTTPALRYFTASPFLASPAEQIKHYADLLGLTQRQGERLFFLFGWPRRFRDAYMTSGNETPESAMVAVQRIHHFIKTDGRE